MKGIRKVLYMWFWLYNSLGGLKVVETIKGDPGVAVRGGEQQIMVPRGFHSSVWCYNGRDVPMHLWIQM